MNGQKIKLSMGIVISAWMSAQGCSRTAISFEGRANREGKQQSIPNSPLSDAGINSFDSGEPIKPNPDAGMEPNIFRVTVYGGDRPRPGIDILFHHPDGRFEHFERTPNNGTIEHEIEPGSMMTVILPPDMMDDRPEYQAFTYTGLMPDEHIHVGKTSPRPQGKEFSVRIRVEDKPDGVSEVGLDVGCEKPLEVMSQSSILVEVTENCLSPDGKLNVLARNGTQSRGDVWFAHVVDFELAEDRENEIVISNWTRGDDRVSATIQDIPRDAQWTYLEANLERGGKRFVANADQGEGGGGRADFSVRIPRGFAESIYYRAAYAFVGDEDFDGYCLNEGSTNSRFDSIELNAKQEFLGRISDVEDRKSQRTNRTVVTWDAEESSTQADGYFVRIRARAGFSAVRWTAILAPQNNESFEFPEIPPEFEIVGGLASATVINQQVISFDSSIIAGYEDLKKNFGITAFDQSNRDQSNTKFAVGGDLNFDGD